MRVKIESLKVSGHVRRMIRTCWDLGGDPRYAELKLRRWAHQLGYGGHFLSKSRRFSTTFGALRQARRDFCTAHTLAGVGLDREGPKAMRVGKYLRYRKPDVDRWLKSRETREAG
jgi:hypothetical protein